jgi:Pyruvate/2-oxoacid:ferredoxin oxidoreductase gamma subunit
LGVLAAFLDTPRDAWQEVIAERVPERYVAMNREAFAAGLAYGGELPARPTEGRR